MEFKEIKEKLLTGGINYDHLSIRGGVVTAKFGYFYRHGRTAAQYAEKIKAAIPEAEVISASDDWQPWPRDSNFVIKFKVG